MMNFVKAPGKRQNSKGGNTMKMKSLIALIALIVLCCCVTCVVAETSWDGKPLYEDRKFQYTILEDGTASIYLYVGNKEDVVIPDTLDGIPVTAIDDWSFCRANQMRSVVIPEGVTYLGEFAFYRLDWLRSVTLPDSLVTVNERNPFISCKKLEEIIISANHPYLELVNGMLISKPDRRIICCLFSNSNEITIPDGVAIIGKYAFDEVNITELIVPDSVERIEADAFDNCYGLVRAKIPASVSFIDSSAFFSAGWGKKVCWTVPKGSYAEEFALDEEYDVIYSD